MESIEIKVTKTTISVINGYVLNQGEYQVDKCKFTFSDEYDGLIKKAVFVNGNDSYEMVILDNQCNIPYEILQSSADFILKVYGYSVENDELIQRYSPTSLRMFLREGSYQGSNEVITPTQFEQYEAKLNEGLEAVDDKLEVVDETLGTMNTAINQANTLNIDVSDKVNKDVTITLTRKDNTQKSVVLSDGTSLQFNWDGTSLGIKTEDEEEYTYVNLKGDTGSQGPQGEAFQIKKTYATTELMIADYDNMNINDYVMISGDIETQENATLWVKTETQDPTYKWHYLADFSGASGIQGPTGATPSIGIGTVTTGQSSAVTRTGTDENPILNFVLEKGDQGVQGETGATGNGITSITKTSTSGLVDTYTILFTNGNTTTFDVTNGEDGEVTQEQLDAVQSEVNTLQNENEYLNSVVNQLPKVTDEDTDILLDKTIKAKLDIYPKGNTYQYSTTGKNLLDTQYYENGSIDGTTGQNSSNNQNGRGNNYISVLPNTTYTLSCNTNVTNLRLSEYASDKTHIQRDVANNINYLTITTTANTYFLRWSLNYDNSTIVTQTIINSLELQLEKGSSSSSYEPYTNGASPNPSYPQDIHIVSGDNTIKVCGKNELSSGLEQGTLNSSGEASSSTTRLRTTDFVLINSNTQYTLSSTTSSIKAIVYEYNKSNTYMQQISSSWSSLPYTFTTSSSTKFIKLVLRNDESTTIIPSDVSNVIINKGSTASTYEPYTGYTKQINLPVENLFDKDNANILNAYLSSMDGIVSNNSARVIYIKCEKSQTYTIQKIAGQSFGVAYTTSTPVAGLAINGIIFKNTGTSITITTGNDAEYLVAQVYGGNDTLTLQQILDSIQIEKGSKANTYTPYGTTPIWGGTIGTYEDEFFKNTIDSEYYDSNLELNKWYLKKRIGKIVLDGSESWANYQTGGNDYNRTFLDLTNAPTANARKLFISNYFKYNDTYNTDFVGCGFISAGRIYLYPLQQDSVSDFTTWLLTHNVVLYYPLATPTYTLLNDTLQATLDSFTSKAGQTNISQANNDMPFVIKASAIYDLNDLINRVAVLETE